MSNFGDEKGAERTKCVEKDKEVSAKMLQYTMTFLFAINYEFVISKFDVSYTF